MTMKQTVHAIDYASLGDPELVALAGSGQRGAFRYIMQRCNQRLFRVARGVLNDDAEAEDAVQEAYVRAFENLALFRGEASVLTWLTRIVLNEAYGRLRQRRTHVDVEQIDAASVRGAQIVPFPSRFGHEDPAAAATRGQMRELIEGAVAQLPEPFRIVFVLREIEECSIEETARCLDIRPETVKTRLHRARRLLRAALQDSMAAALGEAFPFLGPRCARMTSSVLARLDRRDAEDDPPEHA